MTVDVACGTEMSCLLSADSLVRRLCPRLQGIRCKRHFDKVCTKCPVNSKHKSSFFLTIGLAFLEVGFFSQVMFEATVFFFAPLRTTLRRTLNDFIVRISRQKRS